MSDESVTITVTQSVRGWDVGSHLSSGSIFPTTSYPNAAKAAARVLQLMEIGHPVTPQAWPENVCIGFIERGEESNGS